MHIRPEDYGDIDHWAYALEVLVAWLESQPQAWLDEWSAGVQTPFLNEEEASAEGGGTSALRALLRSSSGVARLMRWSFTIQYTCNARQHGNFLEFAAERERAELERKRQLLWQGKKRELESGREQRGSQGQGKKRELDQEQGGEEQGA